MDTTTIWLANRLTACAIFTGGVQILLAIAGIICRDACCRRLADRRRAARGPRVA